MKEVFDTSKTDNINKLTIERLYVKEISCKLPHAPNLFETSEFKEAISGNLTHSLELNIKTQPIAPDKYEVVLHAVINGKAKNLSTFILEVQQAAIFNIKAPQAQIEKIIKSECMAVLYPYLSQVISNAILQAGLPPIMLQPLQLINQQAFDEERSLTKSNDASEIKNSALLHN